MTSLINLEKELPLEKQLMEKIIKQYENYFDIKHKDKDNILVGANKLKDIKEFMTKKLKIDDLKILSASLIQNKINIVNQEKEKFIKQDEDENENNEDENNNDNGNY